jgi:hypothetical protein
VSDSGGLNPSIEPLGFLLGRWRGRGRGTYPTIDAFEYEEDVEFWHIGKPFLGYHQRTTIAGTGLASHSESGFWRLPPLDASGNGTSDGELRPRTVEATITQPTGVCEVLVGTLVDHRIEVAALQVCLTPTAKQITAVERSIDVDGDEMTYQVRMAAVGQPLQVHLEGEMRRVG